MKFLDWNTWSYATRFAILGALVTANILSLIGSWVADRIEDGVVDHAGTQLAYQMEQLLEPATRTLETTSSGPLPASTDPVIAKILATERSERRVLALRIWRPEGTIAYDTLQGGPLSNGPRLPRQPMFEAARDGQIVASRATRDFETMQAISALYGVPVLHVFAPLHDPDTGAVAAVVEYFQNASSLNDTIRRARTQAWFLIALTGLLIFLILYGLVRSGHGEIIKESARLSDEVAAQRRLTKESADMQLRLQQANRLGTELNERYLRRIGSDLHDGPAQHLALALLKIDDISHYLKTGDPSSQASAVRALDMVRQATTSAMREIRNISTGLALPELNRIAPVDALHMALRAHERATGTTVNTAIGHIPDALPLPLVICMFRFTQEGLNNAFRHGKGAGQQLTAHVEGNTLKLEVSDSGPGFEPSKAALEGERLGLTGLRQRVEALGGTFQIFTQPGGGTRLQALFSIAEQGVSYA